MHTLRYMKGREERIRLQERMVRVNINHERRVSYHTMIVLAVIAGAFSIAVQFMPDGEILGLMLSMAALGGLVGGSNAYTERERRQLSQSYKTAFEWLLLAILVAYVIILNSRWLNGIQGMASFLNNHWPVLVLSTMCLLMGIAGFQKMRDGNSS
jgi:hypothetical protein